MAFILKINKTVKESNVLFDCEHDEDLIQIIDKIDYSQAKINDGAKVTYTVICNGYESVSNTLIMNRDYELTPEIKKVITLTIKPYPEDATVVFNYKGKDYRQNSILVTSNTPVKYTVSASRRETRSDVVMIDKDTTLDIKLSLRLDTDEDIANYEKNNTDPLSNIKILNKDEYSNLSDDLRKKHVKLNDLLSKLLGVDYNLTLNDCIVQLYWMLPIVHKLTPFTNGTLGTFQADFINYLSQLNALLTAASGIGNKIKSMRKALNKAGLGDLIDVLTTGFGLIGGLAGIVYGIMNNPNILIQTYAQAFTDIDVDEIYQRTIGETLPNLDYVKGMLNRTYIPEGNLKKHLFDQLEQIDAAADLSLEVIEIIGQLKKMVEVANSSEEAMKEIIKAMSTMSLGWAIGALSDGISRLHLDKDKVKSNMNSNQLADAFKVMSENIQKMRDIPDYYISEDDFAELKKINDERTSSEKVLDYQNGYDDAFRNAQSGETEFQMDLRLAKLKKEMEALGKDPSGYIYGYKVGWESGRKKYENELKNLTTDEQKESYAIGYEDGYNFGKVIKGLASNSLDVGELKWFIDKDLHIHYTNLYPFGRIEGTKVYNFSIDGEEVIGTYNPSSETIYITAEDKYYLIVDNRYIYDTSVVEEQTEEKLNEVIEILYKINVIRVEREPAKNTINPYYAKGYTDGFADREKDNVEINDSEQININGYNQGYLYGQNNESSNKITEEIDNYSEENPTNAEFYKEGLIRGYNTYQAEYNTGYNAGWFKSIKASDYDDNYIFYKNDEYKINNNLLNAVIGTKVYPQNNKRLIYVMSITPNFTPEDDEIVPIHAYFYSDNIIDPENPNYPIGIDIYDFSGNNLGVLSKNEYDAYFVINGETVVYNISNINNEPQMIIYKNNNEIFGYSSYNTLDVGKIIFDERDNNIGTLYEAYTISSMDDTFLNLFYVNNECINKIEDNTFVKCATMDTHKSIIDLNYGRDDFLEQYCNDRGLDKEEQDSLPDNEKNSFYLGAIYGWDDSFYGLEIPNWRENYRA